MTELSSSRSADTLLRWQQSLEDRVAKLVVLFVALFLFFLYNSVVAPVQARQRRLRLREVSADLVVLQQQFESLRFQYLAFVDPPETSRARGADDVRFVEDVILPEAVDLWARKYKDNKEAETMLRDFALDMHGLAILYNDHRAGSGVAGANHLTGNDSANDLEHLVLLDKIEVNLKLMEGMSANSFLCQEIRSRVRATAGFVVGDTLLQTFRPYESLSLYNALPPLKSSLGKRGLVSFREMAEYIGAPFEVLRVEDLSRLLQLAKAETDKIAAEYESPVLAVPLLGMSVDRFLIAALMPVVIFLLANIAIRTHRRQKLIASELAASAQLGAALRRATGTTLMDVSEWFGLSDAVARRRGRLLRNSCLLAIVMTIVLGFSVAMVQSFRLTGITFEKLLMVLVGCAGIAGLGSIAWREVRPVGAVKEQLP